MGFEMTFANTKLYGRGWRSSSLRFGCSQEQGLGRAAVPARAPRPLVHPPSQGHWEVILPGACFLLEAAICLRGGILISYCKSGKRKRACKAWLLQPPHRPWFSLSAVPWASSPPFSLCLPLSG